MHVLDYLFLIYKPPDHRRLACRHGICTERVRYSCGLRPRPMDGCHRAPRHVYLYRMHINWPQLINYTLNHLGKEVTDYVCKEIYGSCRKAAGC